MIKSLLAIAAAAACAGIVVLAPEFASKSAMAATQSDELSTPMQGNGNLVAKMKPQSDLGCTQHWPYYEQSCLRDVRLSNEFGRVVRVIVIDRTNRN
jgi:hypothetical protein